MGNSVISQPDVTINIVSAGTSVENSEHKVLAIGQKLASGTATASTLVEEIGNDNSWDTLFGAKSMLANIVRSFRSINEVTRIDAIPLDDDGASTKATKDIVLAGTATATGTLNITILSETNYNFDIAVAIGDTATVIGDAIVTKIGTYANIPVSANNVTGTVTFTAENGGVEGSDMTIKLTGTATGISYTVSSVTAGTGNPSLTGLFDIIGQERYQTIIYPSSYDISVLTTELDSRFNITNNVLDGVGVITINDTLANAKIVGNTYNSESLVVNAYKSVATTTFNGSSLKEQNIVATAKVCGIRALRLTDGANISSYVIASGKDTIGGVGIASLPYFNTPINLPIIDIGTGWTYTEIEELITAGVSTSGNNRARNAHILNEIVTTYKTDSAGNVETSFKYLNSVDVMSNVREYFFNNSKADLAQSRLTTGEVIEGRNSATSSSFKALLMRYYEVISSSNYALTRNDEASIKAFRDSIDVEVDLLNGKLSAFNVEVPIVTQLRTIAMTIKPNFTVGA